MRCSLNKIKLYTIQSKQLTARIYNYGCTLKSLRYHPDWDKKGRDVVLGFNNKEAYFNNPACYGSCVMPNANRIEGAQFVLNGKTYQLDKNDGENNLHSGFEPLHNRLWEVKDYSRNWIIFSNELKDGECGMPGNRKYTVTYSVEGNRLSIKYFCCNNGTDTLFNPTSHSYFNLMGHNSGDILDHELWISSDFFTPTDEHLIWHGDIAEVRGTPMDFTERTKIGARINDDYDQLKNGKGYDHNYLLNNRALINNGDWTKKPIATLMAPDYTTMNLYTTSPCLQVYTGNYLSITDADKRRSGYTPRSGVALETQFAPNAINVDADMRIDMPIIKANDEIVYTTIYEFE